jgi:hypothetical protein
MNNLTSEPQLDHQKEQNEQEKRKEALVAIVQFLTEKYPFFDSNQQLVYCVAGSFALQALMVADEMELVRLDENDKVASSEKIPGESFQRVKAIANRYRRLMKDVDNVRLKPQNKTSQGPANKNRIELPPELQATRAILFEGSPEKTYIITEAEDTEDTPEIMRLGIGSKELYIPSPMALFVHKFHQMQTGWFDNEHFTQKFINDLRGYIDIINNLYGPEAMSKFRSMAYQNNPPMIGDFRFPFHHPDLPQYLLNFYEAVVAGDPDYHFIQDVPEELKERRLDLLRALYQHPAVEVKKAIVEFCCRNARFIQKEQRPSVHSQNIRLIAELIVRSPEMLSKVQKSALPTEQLETSEDMFHHIKSTAAWAMDYGRLIRDELIHLPESSQILEFLAIGLDDRNYTQELKVVEKSLPLIGMYLCYKLLFEIVFRPYTKASLENRQRIFILIDRACNVLKPDQMNAFLKKLDYALGGEIPGEPNDPAWDALSINDVIDASIQRSHDRREKNEWVENEINHVVSEFNLRYG